MDMGEGHTGEGGRMPSTRLPVDGQDNDQWGVILNQFLQVGHNSDGTLKGILSVYNVKDYGAKGDGTTDDTTAIQNTYNAAAVNGGIMFLPPAIYKISSLSFTSKIVKISGANAILQANTPSISMIIISIGDVQWQYGTVIDGIIVDGNNLTGVNGLEIIDSVNARPYNVFVKNCLGTGILIHNVNSGGYNESHSLMNIFVNACGTGIAFVKETAADSGFDQVTFTNVGITNCTIGLSIGAGCLMVRTVFKSLTLWVFNNQTALVINGDINGARWQIGLESQGTINTTGISIGDTRPEQWGYELDLQFVGTWTHDIIDASGFGLRWKQGINLIILDSWAGADPMFIGQVHGDTYGRIIIHGNDIYMGDGTVVALH